MAPIDSVKLNLFGQSSGFKIQPPVSQVKPVGGQKAPEVFPGQNPFAAATSNSKLFAGSTEGVNANIGVGDTVNIPAQGGKQAGIGRTYGFA